jgi:phytoene dehydrogenase-like protein
MTRASAGELSDRFDIVVAGAGHNSLIAAAYLAKAGFRCLVLGGRPVVGGNCVAEELTLPGFQHDSCGTAHVVIQDSPLVRNDELGLADYALACIHPEILVHVPFADGTWLTQCRDLDRTRGAAPRVHSQHACSRQR